MKLDDELARELETVVDEIETATSAEVVVVACARAGQYPDVPLLAGLLVSAVVLALLILVPTVISAADTFVTLALAFVVAYVLTERLPGLARLLIPRRRRLRELRARAEQEFTRRQVSATEERNGVLVLVGLLEDRVDVVPDLGIENHIRRGELQLLLEHLRPRRHGLEQLIDGLRALGERLAQAWPKTEEDGNDLPNDVRIYP